MPQQEIERKFRLRKKPRLKGIKATPIRQGYLITTNGELRVRESGKQHFVTVKSDSPRDRNEWEKKMPRWVFDLLWPHTAGRRIEKTRYEWKRRGACYAVDVYEGVHDGLIIFEAEFKSKRQSKKFKLPKRMSDAIEVTDDAEYKNRTLATSPVPKEPEP
jgi:CYTH domain-containing protein